MKLADKLTKKFLDRNPIWVKDHHKNKLQEGDIVQRKPNPNPALTPDTNLYRITKLMQGNYVQYANLNTGHTSAIEGKNFTLHPDNNTLKNFPDEWLNQLK